MILPKIQYKTSTFEIPSTKHKLSVHGLTAKDERAIGEATRESQLYLPILKAIKGVVANCIVSEKFDVNSLTMFDLEWLYLQIYAISTKGPHQVAFLDNKDQKVRTFDISLETVPIKWPETDLRKIKITDSVMLCLNYPTIKILDDSALASATPGELAQKMTIHCVDKIIDGSKIFDAKLERVEEIQSWIDNIPAEAYNQLRQFFDTVPTLYHEISYENDEKESRRIVLNSLNDFFTWT